MFLKLSLIVLLSASVLLSGEPIPTQGVTIRSDASSLVMGYCNTFFLIGTSADSLLPAGCGFTNCRAISCDTTGYVKISYINAGGDTITEAKLLNGGAIYPIRNVVKIYRYYTGSTAGTVRSLSSAGVMTSNCIKLHK